MMFDYEIPKKVNMTIIRERVKVISLLESVDIRYEEPADYTAIIEKESIVIATGSLKRNVIKYVAVDKKHRNEGLTNKIVSHLMQIANHNCETHLFVYTKPDNEVVFSDLGFNTIVKIENEVVLMENKIIGISSYIKHLKKENANNNNVNNDNINNNNINNNVLNKERIASIVVNCNPFTLGHRYLIEMAANENNWLHIFVVHENLSVFPTDVRVRLVKEGVTHLSNVTVHDGGEYIISGATFPSYFLKENQDATRIHARLDVTVFGQFIAPALDINFRYVGEEPYCLVTRSYNAVMKEILPGFGIQVVEIPRKELTGQAISASSVRQCIKENDYATVERLVPSTTYDFLISDEGKLIAEAIKDSSQRH